MLESENAPPPVAGGGNGRNVPVQFTRVIRFPVRRQPAVPAFTRVTEDNGDPGSSA